MTKVFIELPSHRDAESPRKLTKSKRLKILVILTKKDVPKILIRLFCTMSVGFNVCCLLTVDRCLQRNRTP